MQKGSDDGKDARKVQGDLLLKAVYAMKQLIVASNKECMKLIAVI